MKLTDYEKRIIVESLRNTNSSEAYELAGEIEEFGQLFLLSPLMVEDVTRAVQTGDLSAQVRSALLEELT